MLQPTEPGRDRPLVVFAAGPGVGRVVDSWRRGGLQPALVDVTEPNLRSALLAEAALGDLRAAGVPVRLRLAPGGGTPTRLEITGVFAAHGDAGYAVAGPAAFMLRVQRSLRSFGIEPVGLMPLPAVERVAA
jgi:hypothetical protein